jgi:hypothetical protein
MHLPDPAKHLPDPKEDTMTKKTPRRDPIIVYKREEKGLQPFLPKDRGFRGGRPAKPQPPRKPKKPKENKPVIPEKVRFHLDCLGEIDEMESPEREIVRGCYFLSFLVHETKTNTDLFPLKHNVLERIFRGAHPALTVSYVRRGDREVYSLSAEAKKKWETETGGNKHHIRMYLTAKCKVDFEEGYFDLYHFHVVVEPFRFSFYLPVHQAPWIDKRRISKRRFHYPQTVEYGLIRGKMITTSRKASLVTLEQITEELNKILEADMDWKKKKK